MKRLAEIVEYLDKELQIDIVPDYSAAMNGLQLANDGSVTKVGAAVDASLATIRKAVDAGVDLLIVHHGLFWHGAQKFVGAQYEKIKLAMDGNMAIYSAHIPLDVHSEYGNNRLLCDLLGMNDVEPFHDWKGIKLGLCQGMEITLDALVERTEVAVGGKVHVCPGRVKDRVGVVGVITGGAGSEVQAMAEAGIDTFITGEGPHWSYPLAEELELNVVYAGHYATETYGVTKIMEVIGGVFSLDQEFINHPTGL